MEQNHPSSLIPLCEKPLISLCEKNPSMGSTHHQSISSLGCSSTPYFISNLPHDVILNILLRLLLPEAARTSVLSKTWRLKWRYLPHLVFDFSGWSSSSSTIRDSTLVCQVLSLHRVPITKFELNSSYGGPRLDLEPINIFLCDAPIQEFTFSGFMDVLPSCLFSFKQLEHLKLSTCRIEPPSTFMGFCKLSSLTFDCVSSECNLYDSLISKCPLLEHLMIVGCTDEMVSLFFPFFIGPFDHTPSSNRPFDQTLFKPFNFFEFLKCVPTLKDLCISFIYFESSDSITSQVMPPIISGHLRVLKIHDVSFDLAKDVIWILCLIKISPNLQKLEITAPQKFERAVEDPRALNLFDAEFERWKMSEASLEHLREVSMFRFGGMVVEFELVKFILTKSVVLEKLHIESANMALRSLDILKMVTDFPRASLNVEITSAENYSLFDVLNEVEDDYDNYFE